MSALVDRLVARLLGLDVKLMACQARLSAETDSEALHDLRINVRRLRSLLRPLNGLPGVEQLETAAKAVGQLTTPLRDREVLVGYLEQRGMAEAARQRSRSLSDAYLGVASSAQLNQLFSVLDAFPRFLRASQHQGLLHDLKKRIETRLNKQWKKLHQTIDDPAHDRHRLRLLIKRVRYAAEAYPELDKTSQTTQKRLKEAQTALGDWHDHLQWLAQAQEHTDLLRCVPGWERDIETAETNADRALERLGKACFKK
ncbi:CHAD domain-containing protein [Pseudomonas sp. CCI3.2]|uniref:CHAD domain-containing protein n=1 Tax=unclassified Pseudomonas TaxID=196821 RepID=UPI002AC9B7D3|nr:MULTISPECIES: CHAD domain-containing protein [unclassified Pseudomonas]MEB0078989.1 CHAD domain-containing protein [Pseudomonas sp. MH10out]MEB0094259.1 CHAD domain-containing protein [Pseudomonas sp. CCI4.2]MEB0103349.1 CHAD domain-containing protein [Pseudomonas sp. CCI3.2]MEB0132704.1 CHAD domain-containing protein [Pseudomonas sp. CCI2.4]MEB0159779.1 CHAD domain-containing protein [Pseudomonas sp. AH2 (2023)]